MTTAFGQSDSDASETQPLIGPLPPVVVNKLCFSVILIALVTSWCVMDSWNMQVTSEIFTGTKERVQISFQGLQPVAAITPGVQSFHYPITLVFLQFVVMTLVFTFIWRITASKPAQDLYRLQGAMSDVRWVALPIAHVFSTFWLQSLVMPSSEVSLGLFSILRAVEIPAAAILRSSILSTRLGRTRWMTTFLMFGAACTLTYAYTQIMNCVCIWSGFGVALSGVSFYLISTVLLVVPAACAVCQEVALVELQVPVFLLLAFQCICGSGVCAAGLFIARLLDLEDCVLALRIMAESPQLHTLTLWLCIQLAATSWLTVQIVAMTDSFWGVALKSTRVIYWQIHSLFVFYFYTNSTTPYSIVDPRSSLWSFVLVCGVVLGVTAICTDSKKKSKASRDDQVVQSGMGTKV